LTFNLTFKTRLPSFQQSQLVGWVMYVQMRLRHSCHNLQDLGKFLKTVSFVSVISFRHSIKMLVPF